MHDQFHNAREGCQCDLLAPQTWTHSSSHVGFGGRMPNMWYPTSVPVALQFLIYAVPATYGIKGTMLGCSHFGAQSCVSLTNVVEPSIPSQLKSGHGSDVYCSPVVGSPHVCSFIATQRWIEIFRCQLSLRCRQVEIVKTVTWFWTDPIRIGSDSAQEMKDQVC